MTWHLKDRELEEKLIAIDTDFIERLNQNCEIWDFNRDVDLCELMHFEQILRYKNKLLGNLLFTGVQLEEVPEYNPHGWNEYPKVTPPEGVPMRVETNMGFGFKARFEHGDWLDNRNDVVGFDDGNVIRFRLWNED